MAILYKYHLVYTDIYIIYHEDSFAQVKGDGACFPRGLALNLFGNEDLFAHIRLFVIASAFVSREAYFSGSGNLKVCLYVVVTTQLYAL